MSEVEAHHMISISNHRELLPHSLHTQELLFYLPNTIIQVDLEKYCEFLQLFNKTHKFNLNPFTKERETPIYFKLFFL